jgi:hypothetical protein
MQMPRLTAFIPHSASVLHGCPVRAVGIAPVHVPLLQVWPAGHTLPQRPQFELSELTSTQLAPHIMRGAAHVPPPVQLPATQSWPDGHARLHMPQ